MSGFYGEAAAELIVGWDGDVRWVCYCIIMWELLYVIWVTALSIWRFFGKAILYSVRYSAQGQDIRTGEDGLWLDETDQPPLTPSTMVCCR